MTVHALDTQMFVALKAFIKKDGKVLVLKDHGTKGLDFPGGKYRTGKKYKDELHREVNEETDLQIKIGKPFHVWTDKYHHTNLDKNDVFVICFFCEYVSGEVKLSEEHDDFEWVDIKSAEKWKEDTGFWKALEEYFRVMKFV